MQEELAWVDEALAAVRKKMDWVSDKTKNKIPYTTDADGNYDDKSDEATKWGFTDGLDWWTNGFWGGLMWLMYQDTKNEKYAEYAKISEEKLTKTIANFYGIHHDVGFMFQPTAAMHYKLTGDKASRRTAIHAANLLAGRFNPAGNFIRAWNSHEEEEVNGWTPFENDVRGWAIIDCLMNLSQLYWASNETKDPRFYNIAKRQADTSLAHFLRADGSVRHIVEFDVNSGEYVKNYKGQGYEVGSSWGRGQAWALYGFAISHRYTQEKKYLDAAKRVAHYCISNIKADGTLPLDYRQPSTDEWEDSCGACIVASGLLEIASLVDENEKHIYRQAAITILKAIYEKRCDFTDKCDAMVQNCSSAYHDISGRHMTMVYADFFFVEGLQKLRNIGVSIW